MPEPPASIPDLTPRTAAILIIANIEAARRRVERVEDIDVLNGIVLYGRCSTALALKELDVNPPRIDEVEPSLPLETVDWSRDLWESGLLQVVATEAAKFGHSQISDETLLLGLMNHPDRAVDAVIRSAGVTRPEVYKRISDILGQHPNA